MPIYRSVIIRHISGSLPFIIVPVRLKNFVFVREFFRYLSFCYQRYKYTGVKLFTENLRFFQNSTDAIKLACRKHHQAKIFAG